MLAMPALGFAQEVKSNTNADVKIGTPILLPTSPFYFIKEFGRVLQTFFTFNAEKRAELKFRIAEEKLVEAQVVSEKQPQNQKGLENALQNYEEQRNELKARLENLTATSKNPNISELVQRIDDGIAAHEELFNQLMIKNGKEPNVSMKDTFTGALEASGPSFQMWGTHKLSVKEVVYCVKAPCPPIEKSYLVKAANDNVLAELEKYEGKNVSITGEAKYYDIEGGFWGIVAEEVSVVSIDSTIISYFTAVPQTISSGGIVRLDWAGKNVSAYKLYTVCPAGVSVIFEKVEACGQESSMGLNTYISGRFTKQSSNLAKVDLELRAYDGGGRLAAKRSQVITIVNNPNSSIQILSPNGGEKWVIGKTYEIKWNATSDLYGRIINISLKESNPDVKNWFPIDPSLIIDNINTTGSHSWKIPQILTRPNGETLNLGEGTYFLRVEAFDPSPGQHQVITDESDTSFSITTQ